MGFEPLTIELGERVSKADILDGAITDKELLQIILGGSTREVSNEYRAVVDLNTIEIGLEWGGSRLTVLEVFKRRTVTLEVLHLVLIAATESLYHVSE